MWLKLPSSNMWELGKRQVRESSQRGNPWCVSQVNSAIHQTFINFLLSFPPKGCKVRISKHDIDPFAWSKIWIKYLSFIKLQLRSILWVMPGLLNSLLSIKGQKNKDFLEKEFVSVVGGGSNTSFCCVLKYTTKHNLFLFDYDYLEKWKQHESVGIFWNPTLTKRKICISFASPVIRFPTECCILPRLKLW